MMRVWFLNVGHGDCTIIEHPSGRLTMIDINNSQNYDAGSFQQLLAEETAGYGLFASKAAIEEAARRKMAQELVDPIAFFKEKFGNRSLHRFILTHPDFDHFRGLRRLFENVQVVNFWDTRNARTCVSFKNDADREDWAFYQALRGGRIQGVTLLKPWRGDSGWAYGQVADRDDLEILSPTPQLVDWANQAEDWNELSLVVRANYAGTSVLLPGDAEEWAWDELVAAHGKNLKSTVLKASHHGRQSGFHLDAVKLIAPQITIASVGRKPDTDAHSHYCRQCSNVWSTRYYGTLCLEVSPNGQRSWTCERNGTKSDTSRRRVI
jgi:beta-lactamase superfamily II metal-dependent hydrolase